MGLSYDEARAILNHLDDLRVAADEAGEVSPRVFDSLVVLLREVVLKVTRNEP